VVGQQNADIVDTMQLRELPLQPFLGFLYMAAHWRHLANPPEPSVCGGDAALCQISLTSTCYKCVAQKG